MDNVDINSPQKSTRKLTKEELLSGKTYPGEEFEKDDPRFKSPDELLNQFQKKIVGKPKAVKIEKKPSSRSLPILDVPTLQKLDDKDIQSLKPQDIKKILEQHIKFKSFQKKLCDIVYKKSKENEKLKKYLKTSMSKIKENELKIQSIVGQLQQAKMSLTLKDRELKQLKSEQKKASPLLQILKSRLFLKTQKLNAVNE